MADLDLNEVDRTNEAERPQWPYPTKLVISLLLVAFFLYLLSRFRLVLRPFILAVILAFILSPAVNFIQRRLRIHRVLSILIVYILLIGVSITIPIALTPVLASQFNSLNLDLKLASDQIRSFLETQPTIAGQTINLTRLTEQFTSAMQGLLEPFVGQTLSLVVEVISSLVWVVFIIIVSFYLIKDSAQLRVWSEQLVPPRQRKDFILLRDEIYLVWSAFFRGQITLALVVACIFSVVGVFI